MVKLKLKNFHQYKNRISIYNVDIDKILKLNKISLGRMGFKHFIGYEDGKKVGPLNIILSKMSTYRRDYDVTKHMTFFIKNGEMKNLETKDLIVSLFTIKISKN